MQRQKHCYVRQCLTARPWQCHGLATRLRRLSAHPEPLLFFVPLKKVGTPGWSDTIVLPLIFSPYVEKMGTPDAGNRPGFDPFFPLTQKAGTPAGPVENLQLLAHPQPPPLREGALSPISQARWGTCVCLFLSVGAFGKSGHLSVHLLPLNPVYREGGCGWRAPVPNPGWRGQGSDSGPGLSQAADRFARRNENRCQTSPRRNRN